jgi:hypothetical protein
VAVAAASDCLLLCHQTQTHHAVEPCEEQRSQAGDMNDQATAVLAELLRYTHLSASAPFRRHQRRHRFKPVIETNIAHLAR